MGGGESEHADPGAEITSMVCRPSHVDHPHRIPNLARFHVMDARDVAAMTDMAELKPT